MKVIITILKFVLERIDAGVQFFSPTFFGYVFLNSFSFFVCFFFQLKNIVTFYIFFCD